MISIKIKGALAIFVKTPGLSPIKTRLAHSIGVENAKEFYLLALRALKKILITIKDSNPNIDIYFSVAEKEGLNSPNWKGFHTVWQEEGGLGSRLSHTYNTLLKNYDFVCFMGADSPHLTIEQIQNGLSMTAQNYRTNFVLGETEDGGFYFFGGGLPIRKELWDRVSYSTEHTSQELKSHLMPVAPFLNLDTETDIDVLSDLEKLLTRNFTHSHLIPEQRDLIDWIKALNIQTNTAS